MDVHFNGYKIKYNLLDHYFKPIRNSQIVRRINIYINLDDLLHRLHRPIVNREFQCCGKNASRQMVSNIFNLVGHYKNWAVKRYMVPRIYLVYTSANQIFKNAMYIPTYRKHFIDINRTDSGDFYFINDSIQNAYRIIPTIAKYLRNIYATDTKYLEPSAIPLYLMEKDHADWNLLISRDEYDLQYAYRDHWSVVSPKGDQSTFINRNNFWEHLSTRNSVTLPSPFHYRMDLYPSMKALAGDRYRGIPKLKRCGWKTIFGYIEKTSSMVHPSDDWKELQLSRLETLMANRNLSVDQINKNLYCTDIEKQVDSFLDSDKAIIEKCIEDMEDFQSLSQINASIFSEFPLNLTFLCRDKIEETTR